MSTLKVLKDLRAEKDFFIGIDSDGCVFDSMEPKHKECFCPAFIDNFNLQSVSRYARDVWEFVNLYSQNRGCNRFHGVIEALDLLRERPEVIKRAVKIMELPVLKAWIQRESKLGNPALKAELDKTNDPELKIIYKWSLDVNAAVEKIIRNIPTFSYFNECLLKMKENADVVVVSQTPAQAIIRDWADLDISKYARFIAGQEIGTKAEHLNAAAKGKYPPEKILMIGDAPGDLKAARSVNALFFPVIPGKEDDSWRLFLDEALDRFFAMNYKGAFQDNLISEFENHLPKKASWQ